MPSAAKGPGAALKGPRLRLRLKRCKCTGELKVPFWLIDVGRSFFSLEGFVWFVFEFANKDKEAPGLVLLRALELLGLPWQSDGNLV